MLWDEDKIRQELQRLDDRTGLNGSDLIIKFNNAKRCLGEYNSQEMTFRFSNYYFQDPDWPVEEALDVIRHEYAHYMAHMIYGEQGLGHNPYWRKCCLVVGAHPIRCYNKEREQYHYKKHKEEALLSARFDTYHIGDTIIHPKYGVGVICQFLGDGIGRSVDVNFSSVGVKRLGLKWVDHYCNQSVVSEDNDVVASMK